MDPDQQYSPAYLAEDRSREVINVIVIFAVLETFFILLFFTARIANKNSKWLGCVSYGPRIPFLLWTYRCRYR